MAGTLDAPRYHGRWHRPRMSVFWWLESWRYTRFVVRELTSVCVAWTALVLMAYVGAAGLGAEALATFVSWMGAPWLVAWHVVVLAGLVYHSVSWFSLAPSAMVVRVGGRRVPASLIVGGNVAAWVVVSAALLWLAGRA